MRGPDGSYFVVMFMAFAFGLIGLSAGCHAYARSNNQKYYASSHFPIPGAHVEVHTLDLVQVGTVLTVGCGGVLFQGGSAMLNMIWKVPFYSFITEAWGFLFWTIWVLACSIGCIVISRDNSAKAFAIVNGMRLPDSELIPNLAIDIKYWHHGYVRFFAVVTFITFFFSAIATWVSFRNLYRKPTTEVKA